MLGRKLFFLTETSIQNKHIGSCILKVKFQWAQSFMAVFLPFQAQCDMCRVLKPLITLHLWCKDIHIQLQIQSSWAVSLEYHHNILIVVLILIQWLLYRGLQNLRRIFVVSLAPSSAEWSKGFFDKFQSILIEKDELIENLDLLEFKLTLTWYTLAL